MGETIKSLERHSETKNTNNVSKEKKSRQDHLYAPHIRGVVQLQETIGNRAVTRLVQARLIQASIQVSQPNDMYEREADRAADQVMRMPKSGCPGCQEKDLGISRLVQRQESSFPLEEEQQVQAKAMRMPKSGCPECQEQDMGISPKLQRQESSFPLEEEQQVQAKSEDGLTAPAHVESRLSSMSDPGQHMPNDVQTDMEDRFGASFDNVRIHADTDAARMNRSINAEAFTYQNHIYFGSGKFSPSSYDGKRLIAHELTHTIQQQGIQRKMIQKRGGTTVGSLSVRSNVISAGLTAGHAWLSYTPTGGSETTYGTWGNRTPIGLHRDLEVGIPYAASRTTDLDGTDYSSLTSFAAANNAWGYINNCASFAARGWAAVTGESLSYRNWIGIPNPSSLGAGIQSANGGAAHGVWAQAQQAAEAVHPAALPAVRLKLFLQG